LIRAMHTVEEALEAVRAAVSGTRTPIERVALDEAPGRFLAEDVAMDHDVPPFTRATMDGFAIRAADASAAGAALRVVGRVHAGERAERAVARGEAVAIMTGAPLPEGADAVVPVEETEPAGDEVRLRRGVAAGSAISRRGEQVAAGGIVARAGTRIHPGLVGVLATAGKAFVRVAGRPTVAVVTTGDEMVPASETPGPSRLRDGNGPTLAGQAVRAGAVARRAGPVPDDPKALKTAFEDALTADVVCVSGGVSMGEKDFVPGVLVALGVERVFHKWAVKPGGPLWFGRKGRTLVFGLPGNPAAAFVGFEVLVVPALRALQGAAFAARETVRARFDGTSKGLSRRQFVPVRRSSVGATCVATPVPFLGSGDPFGFGAADGMAAVPEVTRIDEPGRAEVDVIPLEGTL
jgi:molybdopterin molybdotransferase